MSKSKKELQQEIDTLNDKLGKYTERALSIKRDVEQFQHLPEGMKEKYAIQQFQIKQAKRFVKSGAFPDVSAEQAYVIIEAGKEMDLKPIEALNALYVVNGSIEFYGKGLVNQLTKKGYSVDYLNENSKGVDVKVYNGEGFEEIEKVRKSDKSLRGSKAMKFAPKEKMRYHGVRMIVKFHLPHLVTSAGVGDEKYSQEQEKDNKPVLEEGTNNFEKVVKGLKASEFDVSDIENKYRLGDQTKQILIDIESNNQ